MTPTPLGLLLLLSAAPAGSARLGGARHDVPDLPIGRPENSGLRYIW